MKIKVCLYGLILEDDEGNQKKVSDKFEVKKIIEDVYYNDETEYVIEDEESLLSLAKEYGFYIIENRFDLINSKWGGRMNKATGEKRDLICLIDMMIGLTDREKEDMQSMDIYDLEEKYKLLMKEKSEEQLE